MSALAEYTAALADESTTEERWRSIESELDKRTWTLNHGYVVTQQCIEAAKDCRRRAASLRLTAERQRAEQIGEGFAALEVR